MTELDAFLSKRVTYHATNYTHQSVYAKKNTISKTWTVRRFGHCISPMC